ncbi:TIM-barrel domain-containing protein [Asticcacaulis sp. 201]|uniref:TIM-barrel domain-containing protein n=1 Tax=Asticcacaulis sp. 201 TaxID=3028787 RepID=UPI0029170A74|nr:TIM-barrel domain-containing protein [Asticcacaulis sp. 201]MDV6330680.1 hypothetical protein [Asticcacaulis sp. 201]
MPVTSQFRQIHGRRFYLKSAVGMALASGLTGMRAEAAKVYGETAAQVEIAPSINFQSRVYGFEWQAETDSFTVRDALGRKVASATLQPSLILNIGGRRTEVAGHLELARLEGGLARFVYRRADIDGAVSLTLRFDEAQIWFDPVVVEGRGAGDVVELRWFRAGDEGDMQPSLSHSFLVAPGLNMSTGVSTIIAGNEGIDATFWLGRGSVYEPNEMFQQWGLPAHFFCGYNVDIVSDTPYAKARGIYPDRISDAFCLGLVEAPSGDHLMHTQGGRSSVIFRYRSDLWGNARLPGKLTLGAGMVMTFGRSDRDAIKAYYRLMEAKGLAGVRKPSAKKQKAMTASLFSQWGAQLAQGMQGHRNSQSHTEATYDALKRAGFRYGAFGVDEAWDTAEGSLIVNPATFPDLDGFGARLRKDGLNLALWVGVILCESPQTIGLEDRHMLRDKAGQVVRHPMWDRQIAYLDISQPEVQANVRRRIVAMMEAHRPEFIKFDYGYGHPSLDVACPADSRLAGEAFFLKAAELLADAARSVNPDVVIMYYGLTPLMTLHTDILGEDDPWASYGDYDIEINRRVYFSSILGEIGMPTFGSGGYDWATMPSIWFDTVLAGPMGGIADPSGDERGQTPTREMVARFNGLSRIARPTTRFTLDVTTADPISVIKGAHSPSWIRREEGKIIGLALRCSDWFGSPGTKELRGIIETEIDVVIVAQDELGLSQSRRLGIVPIQSGRLTLVPAQRRGTVTMTEHYADGSRRVSRQNLNNGRLTLSLHTHSAAGVPLEWCEVSQA